ncbi:MAG: hypothetical protein V9E94_20575 [Microthrixaceae bacterium]
MQHRPGEVAQVVEALLSGQVPDGGVAGVPADALERCFGADPLSG